MTDRENVVVGLIDSIEILDALVQDERRYTASEKQELLESIRAFLDDALSFVKQIDVNPEELERLKKCRHECKIDCLLKEYERVKDERDALLKSREPSIMTLKLPEPEWRNKVIWLEIKGKKPEPCLFRECSDRMMFGRYERLMYFSVIGSAFERGCRLRNYCVKWRCWSSCPTKEQMEAIPWETETEKM